MGRMNVGVVNECESTGSRERTSVRKGTPIARWPIPKRRDSERRRRSIRKVGAAIKGRNAAPLTHTNSRHTHAGTQDNRRRKQSTNRSVHPLFSCAFLFQQSFTRSCHCCPAASLFRSVRFLGELNTLISFLFDSPCGFGPDWP